MRFVLKHYYQQQQFFSQIALAPVLCFTHNLFLQIYFFAASPKDFLDNPTRDIPESEKNPFLGDVA